MLYWLGLSSARWSGGARNGERWGVRYRRLYWGGHWTPLVLYHFRRLPKLEGPIDCDVHRWGLVCEHAIDGVRPIVQVHGADGTDATRVTCERCAFELEAPATQDAAGRRLRAVCLRCLAPCEIGRRA